MTVQESYDDLTRQVSPEVALRNLLETSLVQYEKANSDFPEEFYYPLMFIYAAAREAGWDVAIDPKEEKLREAVIGTKEYIDTVLKDGEIIKI